MSSLIPFQFDSFPVRVITNDDGDPWFVARDVALALGYADTADAVKRHCKHSKSLKDIDPANHRGEKYQGLDEKTKLIPESDLYRLTLKSQLDSAERFQDWTTEEVLPSIRKTGSYSAPAPKTPRSRAPRLPSTLSRKMQIARAYARDLKLSEVSRAKMYADIARSEDIEPTFLPLYVEGSLARAMSTALAEIGHPLGSKYHVGHTIYPALVEMGLMEQLARPSTSSPTGTKPFWSLTQAGLKYGRNDISPNNPRETQPLFFASTFQELVGLIDAHLASRSTPPKIKGNGKDYPAQASLGGLQ